MMTWHDDVASILPPVPAVGDGVRVREEVEDVAGVCDFARHDKVDAVARRPRASAPRSGGGDFFFSGLGLEDFSF